MKNANYLVKGEWPVFVGLKFVRNMFPSIFGLHD